jgi:hypothetical protein
MNRVAFVAFTSSLLLVGSAGCVGPAQIGADRETFKTVDALYTAVGLRDPEKVDQCAMKLKSLRDSGKVPEAAYKSLEAIVAQAKDGKWEPALERLSTFMEGQRR